MKRIWIYLPVLIIILSLLISCDKNSDDNSYFIEAEINGVKWRGESGSNYLATRSDNSKMKIFVTTTNPVTGSFNFSSDFVVTPDYYDFGAVIMINYKVGIFDSKIKLAWETTVENDIVRFDIEKAVSQSTFETIGSVSGQGISTQLTPYSFAHDIDLENLNSLVFGNPNNLAYRVKAITSTGMFYYTAIKIFSPAFDKAQIGYMGPNGKTYFALNGSQNSINITSYDPYTLERKGTFSYSYKDDTGNIIQVRNGRFRLKM